MKRHIISRPARTLLPLALAAYALFMPESSNAALELVTSMLLARLLSLASGAAFRITAGSVVNEARLRGNFTAALIFAIIGGALTVAVCQFEIPYISGISIYAAIAGGLINIAQLCSDRLYAAFDSFSPPLFDIITTALAMAGLLMADGMPWLLPACMLPAAIAGFMLIIGLRSGTGIKPGFSILKNAHIAVFSNVLFQGAAVGLSLYLNDPAQGIAVTLAAVALIDMCESPFRRNLTESSEVTLFTALCAISSAAAALYFAELYKNHMYSLLFACFGVLLTGAHIDLRRILMLVCIAALGVITAVFCGSIGLIVAIAAGVALTALCIPEIISLRRVSRARHLQRRRAR